MGIRDAARRMAEGKAAGGGADNIRDGKGTLIVKLIKYVPDGNDGEMVVVEAQVEESTSYEGAKDPDGAPVLANAVGSDVKCVWKLTKFPKVAYANTKAFVFALLDESEESLAIAAAERARTMTPEQRAKHERDGDVDPGKPWTKDQEFALTFLYLTGPEAPAKGMRVKYSTWRQWTKANPGKPSIELTLPKFAHVTQTMEQIAAARAALEGAEAKV